MQKVIDSFEGQYAFLSNFYDSPFVGNIDEIEYPTVEHYFQAQKSLSLQERKMIAAAPTPGKAKHFGRHVDLRPDWEFKKLKVMKYALKRKFDTYPDLKQQLLATGDAILIEGNTWHDNFWGDCSCPKCENIAGKNNLGKLLMMLRDEYREEEK